MKGLAGLAAIVAVSVLSGCATSGLVDVNLNDSQASRAAVRAEVFPSDFFKTRRSMGGLEFGYEQSRGSDGQEVAAGDFLTLGGVRIDGPQPVVLSAKVQQAHMAYVQRISFGRYFELTPRLGLAAQQVDVTARPTAAGSVGAKRDRSVNVLVGIAPRVRFSPSMGAEARVTATLASDRNALDGELAMFWQPVPALALRAGIFWRDQRVELQTDSDLRIKLAGPMVSANLTF